MWFGTSSDRLLRWRNGVFTSFIPPVERTVGLDLSVCPDAAGRLWVGSVQNGVVTLEDESFNRPFPASEIGTVVRALFTDQAGRVWIGNEFGLFCAENGRVKHFTAAEGFPPEYVSAITEDHAGALWIGMAVGQLRRYAEGVFTTYRPKDSPPGPAPGSLPASRRSGLLGGARFWALHADADGVVWVGTLGGGLLRFQNGDFTRYTTHEGLPSEHVSQILEDRQGRLWLGTRAGVVQVSKAALNEFALGRARVVPMTTYGKLDGLPSSDCSGGIQPGCWRSRDGRLWFATAKGAVWADPAEVRHNALPPPVWIEAVAVDGQRVVAADQPAASPATHVPARWRVPPGPHLLEFQFTALSLVSPDKVRFRWRLAGLETDWQPEGNERFVRYNFVPPGEYRFQVQACNNNGVWNESSADLPFTVLAYFWQTWWFKASALLAGFGLVGGTVFWDLRRRHRMQVERLEHGQALAQERLHLAQERLAHQKDMERERARIAQDLHDDLGASLTQISWLGESASRAEFPASERQSLVSQITVKSREMVRAIDEIVWAVNPKNDSLDHLVTYVCDFAEQYFRDTATRCRVDVQEPLPAHSLPSDVRHNLFLAVKEALHNVAKHAGATRVHVRVRVEERVAVFLVEDDGCGFAPEPRPGGDGLENMRHRAAAIGAQFTLHSAPGQGTSAAWKLPLAPATPMKQNHPWG